MTQDKEDQISCAIATPGDADYLVEHDQHIAPAMLRRKIAAGEVFVGKADRQIIAWLRYGYFWDSLPFMNMLVVDQRFRSQGIGTQLITFWEHAMHEAGYQQVMTSSLANERAQHLYRRLGYRDAGAFLLPGEPLEILFLKKLII